MRAGEQQRVRAVHGVPRKIRGARAWVDDAPRASAPAPDDYVVTADAPASLRLA